MSNILGECGRCGMMQRLEECKEIVSAKIDVNDTEKDHEIKSLSVFSPIVEEICKQKQVNKVASLSCEQFNLVFQKKISISC